MSRTTHNVTLTPKATCHFSSPALGWKAVVMRMTLVGSRNYGAVPNYAVKDGGLLPPRRRRNIV